MFKLMFVNRYLIYRNFNESFDSLNFFKITPMYIIFIILYKLIIIQKPNVKFALKSPFLPISVIINWHKLEGLIPFDAN